MRDIEAYVAAVFGRFGVNKSREIARLLYETGKKEGLPFRAVAQGLEREPFYAVKQALLRRRYPESYGNVPLSRFALPRLDLRGTPAAPAAGVFAGPRVIFVEEAVRNSSLAGRLRRQFPGAAVETIPSLRDYVAAHPFAADDYHRRGERVFVVRERFDFTKPCPCTRGAAACGYSLVNLGFGCLYECAYCFLQGYQNIPGILLPANIDDFFRGPFPRAAHPLFGVPRIGSGEFTDSLLFDGITGFSGPIVEFFRSRPELTFEFKTKSAAVGALLAERPAGNVVVSWSLNPPKVIAENEALSASLDERLAAAAECRRAGFGVGFHFDPMVRYEGWRRDYREVVNALFDRVPGARWISLGTLRMTPKLKKVIESRFPANRLLDGELLLGFDGKLRYADAVRAEIYRAMAGWIRKRDSGVIVYLCMENRAVWRASGLPPP